MYFDHCNETKVKSPATHQQLERQQHIREAVFFYTPL